MDKLVLIDGDAILNEAFYGLPETAGFEGMGGVFGFLNILFQAAEEESADYLAVALKSGEPEYRRSMYAEYRKLKASEPEELSGQMAIIRETLTAMETPLLELLGYEAGDIIAAAAKAGQEQGAEVVVVTADRSLLQLADEHVTVRLLETRPEGTAMKAYTPFEVKKEYEVAPEAFPDFVALTGGSFDPVTGAYSTWGLPKGPDLGEKTAAAILRTFSSVENASQHWEEVRPYLAGQALKEYDSGIRLRKKLAVFCRDCEISFYYKSLKPLRLFTPAAYECVRKLGFQSLLSRFSDFSGEQASMEEGVHIVADLEEAEAVFSSMEKKTSIGLKIAVEENELVAAAVCAGEMDTYCFIPQGFMRAEYLAGKLMELCCAVNRVSVIHLKEMLPVLKADEESRFFDASVAAYLLNPLQDSYEYDDLARDYLGFELPSRAAQFGKKTVKKALKTDEETVVSWLCLAARIALSCTDRLTEELKRTEMYRLFTEIEMPLIYSLYRMERAGIRVERQRLKEYGGRLQVRIEQAEKKICKETGESFNINSPKQLGEVLFGHMALPGGKKTKSGYSTAADVLEKLADDYPVVRLILDYRQLTKLNSTYAEGLAAYIGPDERIHGTFNQTITATGRISSTEPNLQNIPVRMELGREIRRIFVPEEGCVFVDADYSQIELRLLAHMSGDERLIGAYRQAEDIHAITASQVFHTPLSEVTPLQRRNAKAVNFGIVYGISSFGLSEGLSISQKEAREYINKYFETYPGVKEFLDRLVADAKETGYAISLYGRRRPTPELRSSNFMQRSFGERAAMNSPLQGTAADIMKIAMVRVDQALRERGLKARIVLQIHDELLVETPKEEAEQVKRLVAEEMKHAADLKVSLEVEAHVGDSWFDAK